MMGKEDDLEMKGLDDIHGMLDKRMSGRLKPKAVVAEKLSIGEAPEGSEDPSSDELGEGALPIEDEGHSVTLSAEDAEALAGILQKLV